MPAIVANRYGLVTSAMRQDLEAHASIVDDLNAHLTSGLELLGVAVQKVQGDPDLSARGKDARLRGLHSATLAQVSAVVAGKLEAVAAWGAAADAEMSKALHPSGSKEENSLRIGETREDLRLLLRQFPPAKEREVIKGLDGDVLAGSPVFERLLEVVDAATAEDARLLVAALEGGSPVFRVLFGGDAVFEKVRTRVAVRVAPETVARKERLLRLADLVRANASTASDAAEKVTGVRQPRKDPIAAAASGK